MRPELYDAEAWELFLRKLPRIREQALEGEALQEELELAWSPLFVGVEEDEAREVYAEVVVVLTREGVVPPDWEALA